jgi:long-chain acyl-CoA synthetase
LVYPDPEIAAAEKLDENSLTGIMEHNRQQANRELPKYSQISQIVLVKEEFEKTPKRNIKRYLYTA